MSAKAFLGERAHPAGKGLNFRDGEKSGPSAGSSSSNAGNSGGGNGGLSKFDQLVANKDGPGANASPTSGDEPGSPQNNPYSSFGSPTGDLSTSIGDGGNIGIAHDGGDDDNESDSGVSIMDREEAMQLRVAGYLKKFAVGRSGFFKNWKRRFFTCQEGVLQYFESEKSTSALSTIDLDEQAMRLVTRPSKRTHPEAVPAVPSLDFVLIFHENGGSEERKLLLRADTAEEHMQWCVIIGAFCDEVDHASDYPVALQ